ncbi:hypothetical protein K402DRAFT_224403 [Aulographum hederae CBS 113979]|uniref:Secreted protein n=1 Tax=Aulographum hederae CBS 113979 TaxID=1176131 RepID=A0A6G1HAH3_9PEZI|nr:hypothetical protein K402DRAFT_224403 [Aulographum hederae CBS 113979]
MDLLDILIFLSFWRACLPISLSYSSDLEQLAKAGCRVGSLQPAVPRDSSRSRIWRASTVVACMHAFGGRMWRAAAAEMD